MFVWCKQDSLAFAVNEPPIFEEFTVDHVVVYFCKIPLEESDEFDYMDLPNYLGSGKVIGNHLKGLLT